MLKKTESLRQDITQAFRTITDYYFPILKDNYDDWTTRMQDINILWQVSSRYDSLQDMLSDFAIEGTVHNNDKMQDALVLSTIHSAKGLEWDNVFIIGLMDGVLPSAVALKNDNDIEEESRLLYVAVTRARHQLFLSMHNHPVSKSNRWNGWDGNELSRFLNKRNVLEKLNRR
jgi:DNA helicase-2/ATP-dependent DNA helicase PcrA